MALGSLSVLNAQRSAGSGPTGHQFPLPNTIDKGLQPHQQGILVCHLGHYCCHFSTYIYSVCLQRTFSILPNSKLGSFP